jgi:glutathionyl-hydroquinone reductase
MDIESVIKELVSVDIVSHFLHKCSKKVGDTQTIYGDLHDYLRDMYMLPLHDREVVIERLIGKYVIKHIYEVKL